MVSTETGITFLIGFASGAAAATGLPILISDLVKQHKNKKAETRWDG